MTDYTPICGIFAPAECLPNTKMDMLLVLATDVGLLVLLLVGVILLAKLRRHLPNTVITH